MYLAKKHYKIFFFVLTFSLSFYITFLSAQNSISAKFSGPDLEQFKFASDLTKNSVEFRLRGHPGCSLIGAR